MSKLKHITKTIKEIIIREFGEIDGDISIDFFVGCKPVNGCGYEEVIISLKEGGFYE